jgi:hypothetical protein
MNIDCILYRNERIGDKDYFYLREYCDGLIIDRCPEKCPFFKSRDEWKAIVVSKMTQYVKRDEN